MRIILDSTEIAALNRQVEWLTQQLRLYRQEQELVRLGVSLSRQTMANWIMTAHQRWFSDFVQALRRDLLSNEILHADETTLMVL